MFYKGTLESVADGAPGLRDKTRRIRRMVEAAKRDPNFRAFVVSLLHGLPWRDHVGEVERIVAWVKENVRYMRDPSGVEVFTTPQTLLGDALAGEAAEDCDGMVTLASALLETAGYKTRYRIGAIGPEKYRHIWLDVNVPRRGWVPIEMTREDAPLGFDPGSRYPIVETHLGDCHAEELGAQMRQFIDPTFGGSPSRIVEFDDAEYREILPSDAFRMREVDAAERAGCDQLGEMRRRRTACRCSPLTRAAIDQTDGDELLGALPSKAKQIASTYLFGVPSVFGSGKKTGTITSADAAKMISQYYAYGYAVGMNDPKASQSITKVGPGGKPTTWANHYKYPNLVNAYEQGLNDAKAGMAAAPPVAPAGGFKAGSVPKATAYTTAGAGGVAPADPGVPIDPSTGLPYVDPYTGLPYGVPGAPTYTIQPVPMPSIPGAMLSPGGFPPGTTFKPFGPNIFIALNPAGQTLGFVDAMGNPVQVSTMAPQSLAPYASPVGPTASPQIYQTPDYSQYYGSAVMPSPIYGGSSYASAMPAPEYYDAAPAQYLPEDGGFPADVEWQTQADSAFAMQQFANEDDQWDPFAMAGLGQLDPVSLAMISTAASMQQAQPSSGGGLLDTAKAAPGVIGQATGALQQIKESAGGLLDVLGLGKGKTGSAQEIALHSKVWFEYGYAIGRGESPKPPSGWGNPNVHPQVKASYTAGVEAGKKSLTGKGSSGGGLMEAGFGGGSLMMLGLGAAMAYAFAGRRKAS